MSVISISSLNRNATSEPSLDGSDEVFAVNSELANARMALGLSPEAIAQELNLTPEQILALERGDYSDFPGMVYLKGYLRNYARFVGVDPDRVVRGLDGQEQAQAVGRVSTDRSHSRRYRPQRTGRVVFPLILLACALIVVGFGWLVFSNQFGWQIPGLGGGAQTVAAPQAQNQEAGTESSGLKLEILAEDQAATAVVAPTTDDASAATPSAASTAQSASRSAGIPITTNTVNATANSEPTAGGDTLAATGITLQIDQTNNNAAAAPADEALEAAKSTDTTDTAPAVIETPRPATQTAPESTALAQATAAPAPGGSLVLSGLDTSWVEISDGDGTLLYEANLAKGQIVEFQSPPPFNIVLGNAAAVEVSRNGAVIDTVPFTRAKVARFVIDANGATASSAAQ